MILKINIANLVVSIVGVILTLVISRDSKLAYSVGAGALIGLANFFALAWIMTKILGASPGKARLAALIVFKFLLLIFILFAVIKWLPINIIAFLAGLSAIFVSILCTSLIFSFGSVKK